jgi:opacity protein-like surface antigen
MSASRRLYSSGDEPTFAQPAAKSCNLERQRSTVVPNPNQTHAETQPNMRNPFATSTLRNGTRSLGFIPASFITFLCMTTASFAAEPEEPAVDYALSGIYFGLGFGLAFENYVCFLSIQDYEVGMGFDLFLGYRINRWIAAEVQYEYIDRVDSKSGSPEIKTGLQSFGLNAKTYFPVGRFQPFVLTGLGVTRADWQIDGVKDADSSLSFRLGGGLEWYWTEHFAFTASASYMLPVCKSDEGCDYQYVSALFGGQWRF